MQGRHCKADISNNCPGFGRGVRGGLMHKMITVRVTPDQHKKIKMLSAETGLSIKEIFWLGVDRAEKVKEEYELVRRGVEDER